MHRLELLKRIHEVLQPSTYLEIGVRKGASIALSQAQSIGIDPAYAIETELGPNVALFQATSDDYFRRDDVLAPFEGRPVELALIDGMHLFEYALRDFINIERHCDWCSVIIFDDTLPRRDNEAARKRRTKAWTGDVYKLAQILERHRPDLACVSVDARPTGMLIVLGADPFNTTLRDRYQELVVQHATTDSQRVPEEVLSRAGAVGARDLLEAPFWPILREGNAGRQHREKALPRLMQAIEDWDPPRVKPYGPLHRRLNALQTGITLKRFRSQQR